MSGRKQATKAKATDATDFAILQKGRVKGGSKTAPSRPKQGVPTPQPTKAGSKTTSLPKLGVPIPQSAKAGSKTAHSTKQDETKNDVQKREPPAEKEVQAIDDLRNVPIKGCAELTKDCDILLWWLIGSCADIVYTYALGFSEHLPQLSCGQRYKLLLYGGSNFSVLMLGRRHEYNLPNIYWHLHTNREVVEHEKELAEQETELDLPCVGYNTAVFVLNEDLDFSPADFEVYVDDRNAIDVSRSFRRVHEENKPEVFAELGSEPNSEGVVVEDLQRLSRMFPNGLVTTSQYGRYPGNLPSHCENNGGHMTILATTTLPVIELGGFVTAPPATGYGLAHLAIEWQILEKGKDTITRYVVYTLSVGEYTQVKFPFGRLKGRMLTAKVMYSSRADVHIEFGVYGQDNNRQDNYRRMREFRVDLWNKSGMYF
jgi:hypothetical protein